jgi:hypothetical protein
MPSPGSILRSAKRRNDDSGHAWVMMTIECQISDAKDERGRWTDLCACWDPVRRSLPRYLQIAGSGASRLWTQTPAPNPHNFTTISDPRVIARMPYPETYSVVSHVAMCNRERHAYSCDTRMVRLESLGDTVPAWRGGQFQEERKVIISRKPSRRFSCISIAA